MSGRVVVVGTAVIDVIGYANHRPQPGETIVGTGYEIAAGGKGLNQAIAAARAGAPASLMAAVGADDFGARLRQTLEDEQVDLDAVYVRAEDQTGVGMPIVTEDGDNSIVVVPGASSAIGADHHAWMDGAVDAGTVFLSQLELPMDVVAPVLERAGGLGARVVLNPAPAADITDLLPFADVLVPNHVEAASLTGLDDPARAAAALATWRQGVEVVVTCGADGAVYVDDGDVVRLPAPVVDAVDTVGAGDVFCGYFAARLWRGAPLGAAVADAIRAASISVTRRGAATSAPFPAELVD